jgi:hypothetical protein
MKFVEAAIYAARIPQVTPQRHDARSPSPKSVLPPFLRPPVTHTDARGRSTVDARLALAAAAQKQAEKTRV